MFRITNIFLILILLMLAACQSSHPAKDVNAVDPGVVREPLLNANKKVVERKGLNRIRKFYKQVRVEDEMKPVPASVIWCISMEWP
jgi:uncharacterized protein YcfL